MNSRKFVLKRDPAILLILENFEELWVSRVIPQYVYLYDASWGDVDLYLYQSALFEEIHTWIVKCSRLLGVSLRLPTFAELCRIAHVSSEETRWVPVYPGTHSTELREVDSPNNPLLDTENMSCGEFCHRGGLFRVSQFYREDCWEARYDPVADLQSPACFRVVLEES